MKRERRFLFLLFVMCLVAAMPFAWGAGGLKNLNRAGPSGRNDGVNPDVSTKVTLCHVPPGNPANAHTIVVGEAAVPAHLAHGDYLGECEPACNAVPSAVPKTGQTQCWSREPFDAPPVDCAGTGQDGEHQKGASASPRFADNGDGTVTDNLTGLIWLGNANCLGFRTWGVALSMSNSLASGLCGLTDGSVAGDWRLPNIRELQSLIDYGRANPALPAGHPFGVVKTGYWSSTSVTDPIYAWWVFFASGELKPGLKIFTDPGQMNPPDMLWIWPVRDRQ